MIQLIRKFYDLVGDFGGNPQTPLEKEANEAAEKYWQEIPAPLKRVMCQTETECAFADGYIAAASNYLPQTGEGWIRIEDELPDETMNYLWCAVPVVEPPYSGSMLDNDFPGIFYFTHYMPMPNSFFPEEQKKDEV